MAAEHAFKVTPSHLQRDAYLYVRQSTLRQVLENTESTQRQYNLRNQAVALGWSVMGLEVSRLARNSMDWHRLLDLCALSETLILDEEGLYDPAHFNDRLLLGMKKTSTYNTDFTSGALKPPFPADPILGFG